MIDYIYLKALLSIILHHSSFFFEKLNQNLTYEINEKSKETVNKIKTDNQMHLNVLWLESESFEEWKEYLENLIKRID